MHSKEMACKSVYIVVHATEDADHIWKPGKPEMAITCVHADTNSFPMNFRRPEWLKRTLTNKTFASKFHTLRFCHYLL
jgi:hypothetical protein